MYRQKYVSGLTLERVDALASLLNLSPHNLRNQLGDELLQVAAGAFPLHNLEHLLADGSDLGALCVSRLLDLVNSSSGEADDEDSKQVSLCCAHILVSLNQGLPLSHERSKLVLGEIHAVEVGQAGSALNLFDAELELSESLLVVLVQVSQRSLHDTALERIVGVLCRRRRDGILSAPLPLNS